MDKKKYFSVSEIVSIISEKLDNALQSCSLIDEKSAEKNINGQCMISVFQPRLNPALVQVIQILIFLFTAFSVGHSSISGFKNVFNRNTLSYITGF